LTKETHSLAKNILICQGNACSLSDSAKVLTTFQIDAPSDVKISGSSCLGQCGNGPMVLVLPDKTWYSEVSCHAAKMIIKQHLLKDKPVVSLLYRKFHPLPISESKKSANLILGGLIVFSLVLTFAIAIIWLLNVN